MASFYRSDYITVFVHARDAYIATPNKKARAALTKIFDKLEIVLGELDRPDVERSQ